MHAFANVKSLESIILTLSVESTDQRYTGPATQAMNSAITATLKNETYLERDGKRHFLHEYVPPGQDGFGARFIFLRTTVDERPFINGNTGHVRFFTKYPNGMKVDRRFKVQRHDLGRSARILPPVLVGFTDPELCRRFINLHNDPKSAILRTPRSTKIR